MTAGRLIGVGVGPGDPEHLTLKAVRALQEADRVFVPRTAGGSSTQTDRPAASGEPGRAERIVAAHVAPERLERLTFAMQDDAARADNWDRAGAAIAAVVAEGGTAAFATVGDPNLYSTFTYVWRTVAGLVPGLVVETVPGITALQDLAARSGTVLAEGDERLALVPASAGEDLLRAAIADFESVVVYKGGRRLAQVLEAAADHDRLEAAVYGAELGQEGEEVGAAAGRTRGPYMSTVLLPPPPGAERGSSLTRSRAEGRI